MTAKKSRNTVESTAIPSRERADKRARFAPEEKKGQRGASPLVLVGGILIVLLLIGGAAIALPRLISGTTQARDNYPSHAAG
jgi:hypothetical protein